MEIDEVEKINGKAMIRIPQTGYSLHVTKRLPRTSNRWYQKFVQEEMYPVRPRLWKTWR